MNELSENKILQLIHALAVGTPIDNIIASEGYSREFIEEFAIEYQDEICRKRSERKEDFGTGSENTVRYGIDVSAWQGVISWNLVKRDRNGEFAMLRAAYGLEEDSRFQQNYSEATAADVPVGAYLYSLAATVEDALDEADFMLRLIDGKTFDYPIVYDVEERDQALLGADAVSRIVDAFCQRVQNEGYYVSLYSYESFLADYVLPEVREKYDLWIADLDAVPDLPFGMRQYSFEGRVSGINGDVDLDQAVKDYPAIIAALHNEDK